MTAPGPRRPDRPHLIGERQATGSGRHHSVMHLTPGFEDLAFDSPTPQAADISRIVVGRSNCPSGSGSKGSRFVGRSDGSTMGIHTVECRVSVLRRSFRDPPIGRTRLDGNPCQELATTQGGQAGRVSHGRLVLLDPGPPNWSVVGFSPSASDAVDGIERPQADSRGEARLVLLESGDRPNDPIQDR